jgi:hypothetical protein
MRGFPVLKRRCPVSLCLALLMIASSAEPNLAQVVNQQATPWDIGVIHVPEENHASVIPPNYWPMDREELERRMALRRRLDSELLFQPEVLEEAIYVASLSRDALFSEHSRWKFRGFPGAKLMSIGTVSFALRDARGLPEDQVQLSNDLRFNSAGAIEITSQPEAFVRWFGFQSAASEIGRKRGYQLQLPAATLGRMFIASDPELVLHSDDVVIQEIDEISKWLPNDWPQSNQITQRAQSENHRWWLVNLSGISSFSIELDYSPAGEVIAWQQAVQKTELIYQIGNETVEANALFEIAGQGIGGPLRVQISPELRVRSILINGQPAGWRSISSAQDRIVIQLSGIPASQLTNRIEVKTVARLADLILATGTRNDESSNSALDKDSNDIRSSYQLRLPALGIDGGFTLRGLTHVFSSARTEAIMTVVAGTLTSSFQKNIQTEDEELPSWSCEWTGQAPLLAAQTNHIQPEWASVSFTRLSVQSTSVSAVSSIRLSGKNLSSNEIKLPVFEDWIIDSARIVGENNSSFRVHLDNDSTQTRQVTVGWQMPLSEVEVELQVVGHRSLEVVKDHSSRYLLRQAGLVRFPSWQPDSYYSIEVIGNIRLIFSGDLLRAIASDRDLPEPWQSREQDKNRLIFRDGAEGAELFRFTDVGSQFSAKTVHAVTKNSRGQWTCTTLMNCEPKAGLIDRFTLQLERQESYENWKLDFVHFDGTEIALTPRLIESGLNETVRIWEVTLPIATGLPFVIRSVSVLPVMDGETGATVQISTLGLPDAITSENMLFLPNQCLVIDDQSAIELLPPSSCCHPSLADRLLELLETSDLSEYMAARLDGGSSHVITMQETAKSPRSSWIWSEKLEHRINDSGESAHLVSLDLQSVADDNIAINVPPSWTLVELTANGRSIGNYSYTSANLVIPVDPGQRSSITARFNSSGPPIKWLKSILVSRPVYELPILQRYEWVELPPRGCLISVEGQLSIGVASQSLAPSWWQRWKVWNLWRTMHDSILGNLFPSAEYPGWSRSLIVRDDTDELPYQLDVVNRYFLLSMSYTAIFLLAGFFWFSLRLSFRFGMILLVSLVVIYACIDQRFIFIGQLALFSFAIGLAAWIIQRIQIRMDSDPKRHSKSASGFTRTALILSLFILQPQVAECMETGDFSGKPEELIYGVIVPADEQNQPVGDYVYIPPALREKLYSVEVAGLGPEPPKILSANYLLKFRQNPRDIDPVQECSIELRVMISDTQSEILLPFHAEGLRWLSTPLLNGQPRILDGRSFRLDPQGKGIYFRGETVGTSTVTLQFKPMVKEVQERRFDFSVSIPVIPNSVLRLSPSGLVSNIRVESRGLVQRSFLGDTIAQLGPVDRLQVSWSEADRNVLPVSTEQTTQTWVTVKDDQVIAAALLKIDRSRGLPREVDLIMDANWVPVGTTWGDAELISSQSGTGFRRRTILRVRLMDTSQPEYLIRMLMVPRDLSEFDTIEVPFLSLDRVSTKARYFWLSSSLNSKWTADLVDSRPWQEANLNDWEPFVFSQQRSGYQLVGSNIQLRRESRGRRVDSYVETTALRLLAGSRLLNYEAQWESNGSPPESIQLNLPTETQTASVEVNGIPIQKILRFSNRLIVPLKENGIARISRLKIEAALQLSPDEISYLPQIRIEDIPPRKSTYQLYRGASIHVDISSRESGLDFLPPLVNQNWSQAVERLETIVGEADLPTEWLGDSPIPTKIRTRPLVSAAPEWFVTYMDRTNDGWFIRVESIWSAGICEQDFAFFEVPFFVRDNLIGSSLPCRFLPHTDPSKTNLCVPITPADSKGQRRVEFSFRLGVLPATQGLTIPSVSQLNQALKPMVALPKTIDQQPVRWRHRGDYLDPAPEQYSQLMADFDNYLILPPDEHMHASWQMVSASRKKMGSSTIWVELTGQSDSDVSGVINYWCHPVGHVTQQFFLPEHFEILGVECGNQTAIWSKNGHTVNVTLQPNYLPIQIRMTGRWKASGDNLSLQLPRADGWEQPKIFFLTHPTDFQWLASGQAPMTIEAQRHGLVERWTELISSVAPALPGMPIAETSNWLNDWHPDRLGFEGDWMLGRSSLRDSSITYDLNGNGIVSVAEFWSGISALADLFELQDMADSPPKTISVDTTTWAVSGTELDFYPAEAPTESQSLHWGLGLVVWGVSTLLLLFFGKTIRQLATTADRGWINWLALAIIAGLFLPFIWPAIAIAAIGTALHVSQFIEQRRRAKRFAV